MSDIARYRFIMVGDACTLPDQFDSDVIEAFKRSAEKSREICQAHAEAEGR